MRRHAGAEQRCRQGGQRMGRLAGGRRLYIARCRRRGAKWPGHGIRRRVGLNVVVPSGGERRTAGDGTG